jgi:hypothetical protein
MLTFPEVPDDPVNVAITTLNEGCISVTAMGTLFSSPKWCRSRGN